MGRVRVLPPPRREPHRSDSTSHPCHLTISRSSKISLPLSTSLLPGRARSLRSPRRRNPSSLRLCSLDWRVRVVDERQLEGDRLAALSPTEAGDTRRRGFERSVAVEEANQRIQQDARLHEATSGAQFQANQAARQMVGSAFAFHAGQRYNQLQWSQNFVDKMTDAWFEMFGNDPQMVAAIQNDAAAMAALTDEGVAEKISRGEDLSEFADIWDSIAEVAWDVGAREEALAVVKADADSVKGTFEALDRAAAFRVMDVVDKDREFGDLKAFEGRELPSGLNRTAGIIGAAESGGAWSFDPDAGLLAVTFGEGDEARSFGLETRAGFAPTSEIEVLAEVVYASEYGKLVGGDLISGEGLVDLMLDVATKVGEFADGNVLGDTIDTLWEGLGSSTLVGIVSDIRNEGHPFEVQTGPLDRAQAQLEAEKEAAVEGGVGYRPPLAMQMPIEALIATIAQDLTKEAGEQGLDISTGDALTLASDAVTDPQVRSQLRTEWWESTKDEVTREVLADLEETTAVRAAVEGTLEGALDLMVAWDAVSQQIGITVLAATPFASFTSDEFTEEFGHALNPVEGFRRFQLAFNIDTAGEAPRASDYFGIDTTSDAGARSFGEAINIAVGVGFDPLNFFFPGAKGANALFRKTLTNPKYASMFVRMGGVRRITKPIAETTGRKALSNVLYLASEGMSDDGIRALRKLAQSADSTLDDVEKVLLRELPNTDGVGWFIGGGPNRAIRHATIEGFGRMAESAGLGKLNEKALDGLFDLSSKMGRTRALDLGENMALTNWADLVMMIYPNDMDTAMKWFIRAVDQADDVGRAARVGAKQVVREKASRKVSALGRHRTKANKGFDVRGAQANRDSLTNSMRLVDDLPLDDQAKQGIRTQMRRRARQLDDDIAAGEAQLARYEDSAREAHQAVTQAHLFEADMMIQPGRRGMAELLYEFYDDIAQQINKEMAEKLGPELVDDVIPIQMGPGGRPLMNPLAPDVPMRDWSQVTGVKRGAVEFIDEVKIAQGLGIDDTTSAALRDIGFMDRMQRVITPASPYEIMLYRKIRTNSPIYKLWENHLKKVHVDKVTTGMKLLFGMNLLLNPITMAKVTLDETFRFFASTGLLGKTVRSSVAGLPGAGLARTGVATGTRATTRALGEVAPVLRKIPGWKSLENARGTWVSNPWALQHQRTHEGFLSSAKFQWIAKDSPGVSRQSYMQQAERWVNGSLLNDPIFQAYGRYLPDAQGLGALGDNTYPIPEGFARWWNEGDDAARVPGAHHAKTEEFVVGSGRAVDVDAQFAWNTVQDAYNQWLNLMVDDGQRHVLRRRLVEAAAKRSGKLSIVDDPHLLLAIKQVPGLAAEGGVGARAVGNIFNGGFGNPSARRAGVFFEHYYDQAYQIYDEAYRAKNRLLTKEALIERGFDEATALEMLQHGSQNPAVRRLIDETGMVTVEQIEANAARFAGLRADDLMYRFTAGSLAGQGVEAGLMFPFARAQMDFLSWWSDHLTRPMQLRGSLQRVLPDRAVDAIQSIPLNARAWSKYAHLNAAMNDDLQSPLGDAIDAVTFFPFRWSNEFFLDVLPQAGPMPSWILGGLAESGLLSDDVIDSITAFQPALEYHDANDGWWEAFLPTSKRSLRDAIGGTIRAGATLFGRLPEETEVAGLYGWLIDNRQPAAIGDFTSHEAALFLKENALSDGVLGVPGSAEWDDAVAEFSLKAGLEANSKEWTQDFQDRLNPLSSVDREYRALVAYEGLVEDEEMWGLLEGYGLLSGSDLFDVDGTPRLKLLYERWKAGEATLEEKQLLDDSLTRIFHNSRRVAVSEAIPDFSVMDMLLLEHPDLAVNLISKSECSGVTVKTTAHREFHDAHCNPQTGRLQGIPPGPQGADIFRTARQSGWIVGRPPWTENGDGWVNDAHESTHLAARRGLDAVWYHITGKEWRPVRDDNTGLLRPARADQGVEFGVTGFMSSVLAPLGVNLEPGERVTTDEMFDLLVDMRGRFAVEREAPLNLLEAGPVKGLLEGDPFGKQLLADIGAIQGVLGDLGINTFEEWPEEVREAVRDEFNTAIELGIVGKRDYDRHVAPLIGDLDFEASVPASLDDAEAGLSVPTEMIQDGTVQVLDGDTLSLLTENGPLRVRLIGINAPETTQQGYTEATEALMGLLDRAERVDLVVYDPDLFGVTQLTGPGEERLLMWLFVDGVPIYDPDVFTSENPRGAGVGGNVLDLDAILEAGR